MSWKFYILGELGSVRAWWKPLIEQYYESYSYLLGILTKPTLLPMWQWEDLELQKPLACPGFVVLAERMRAEMWCPWLQPNSLGWWQLLLLGNSTVSPSQPGMHCCWASYRSRARLSVPPALPLAILLLRGLNFCWSFTTGGHCFSHKAGPMPDTCLLLSCLNKTGRVLLEHPLVLAPAVHAESAHGAGAAARAALQGIHIADMEIALEQSEEWIKFGSDWIKTLFFFNMAFQWNRKNEKN